MGKEARSRAATKEERIAAVEKVLGPLQEHDVHRGNGCPACGGPSDQFRKQYCAGVEIPGALEGPCQIEGGHLHVRCGTCGFEWRQQCASVDMRQ